MYCVIMGDIVKSRELDETIREKILQTAKNVFGCLNAKYMPAIMASFGMVRGDAFEGILFSPTHAPAIVQEILKDFYHTEKTIVRISVVTGSLVITGSDRNEVDGPAFHTAVARLEEMKKQKSGHWLQVSFHTGNAAQPLVDSQMRLLAALTESWTDRQREIAWELEARSMQQKLVSEALGISASAVNKQLKAAQYDAYCRAWKSLTDYFITVEEEIVAGMKPANNYTAFYSAALRRLQQHQYADALVMAQKCLPIAKAELGVNNPQLSFVYNLLSEIYTALSLYDKAENAVSDSLRLQEKLPKARLLYAETLRKQARIYTNYAPLKGKASFKQALEIARNAVGEEHPFTHSLQKEMKNLPDTKKMHLVTL